MEQEKRKLTAFPEFPAMEKEPIMSYFHQLDMYFMDRLEFRDALVGLASYFPKQEDTSRCYEGKQNWLFLGNNYDRCVDSLTGVLTCDARTAKRKASVYAKMHEVARNRGAQFFVMLGPNKSTIYPEYLPKTVKPAPQRYVQALVEAMKDAGVPVFDPTEMLREHKPETLLYWRTDTHWNKYGCYLALEAFHSYMGLPFFPHCQTIGQEPPHQGDLVAISGRMDFPVTEGDSAVPRWDGALETPLSDKKVLVIGDSFSIGPMEYLEKVYPVVHRIHYRQIPRKPMESLPSALEHYLQTLDFQPDVIMWIQVERAFRAFP